jgi:capsular polysaccharide export protein
VRCYGQPFYAGWGLTDDVSPVPRRGRERTLDELVAASLLLYPSYVDWQTGESSTAEAALAALVDQHRAGGGVWWRPLLRAAIRVAGARR